MNLNCTSRVIKYLLIIFNFLFVISGMILTGIGVSVKTIYSDYHTFLDDKYYSLPNMLIATGSIIFFVSLCGYCGAFKESWLFVGIFAVLMIIIFIFELSIGIAGYVLRDRTTDFLRTELRKNMDLYNKSEVIVMTMWDTVQQEFECCGVDSYTDWDEIFHNGSLPISCCPKQYGSIGVFYCNSNFKAKIVKRNVGEGDDLLPNNESSTVSSTTILSTELSTASSIEQSTAELSLSSTLSPSSTVPYKVGCVSNFGSYIRENASDLAAAGMALAVIQILGIAFAFHLARQLRNGGYVP